MGYESIDDLHGDFSGRIGEVVDGGDGGALGPKDEMAVGILLVLSFRWVNGPRRSWGSIMSQVGTWIFEIIPNHELEGQTYLDQ